jgi:hypothetical protein
VTHPCNRRGRDLICPKHTFDVHLIDCICQLAVAAALFHHPIFLQPPTALATMAVAAATLLRVLCAALVRWLAACSCRVAASNVAMALRGLSCALIIST